MTCDARADWAPADGNAQLWLGRCCLLAPFSCMLSRPYKIHFLKYCPVSEWVGLSSQVRANVSLRIFVCSPTTTAQYALLVWLLVSCLKTKESENTRKVQRKTLGHFRSLSL